MRQLGVRNIGRDQPMLPITNDLERTTNQLFTRYAERMSIENGLDAYISRTSNLRVRSSTCDLVSQAVPTAISFSVIVDPPATVEAELYGSWS